MIILINANNIIYVGCCIFSNPFMSFVYLYQVVNFSFSSINNRLIQQSKVGEMSQSIRVVVRIRPINKKQESLNCESILIADEPNNQIAITNPNEPAVPPKTFAYDSVFGPCAAQQLIYSKSAYNLVENVLQGYNGTIFAYGQTGCGKTHSMVGKVEDSHLMGIIPRSFGHILGRISQTTDREFLIRCSFVQIYNQQVRDLLGKDVKKSLEIKESPEKGVFIKDLSSNSAKTLDQLMGYMNLGNKNRSVGETAMNKDSSRSHLLFMLYLESADLTSSEENRKYIGSKLNLVDLAGSQRINKTGAQGQRLQEAKSINLSLSALGNVISALVDSKSHHIPYRDSKLTRLLQDSLGGNTKTVMIANCSPADYNFDETISTLRYASRAKFIKNKPVINEDPKDALLKEYMGEIRKLKEILSKGGSGRLIGIPGKEDGLDQRMRQKEMQLASEKEEKKRLQERLQALEREHLNGHNVHIDNSIKKKIEQAKRQSILVVPYSNISESKNIRIQQMPSQHQNSNNNNNGRVQIRNLKSQIKCIQSQISDIQHEHYLDKELLLNDIRDLSKQNKLLQGIVAILLSPKELETVKKRIEMVEGQQKLRKGIGADASDGNATIYGDDIDRNKYVVPAFVVKDKDVVLPKLAAQGAPMEFREPRHFPVLNSLDNNASSLKRNSGSLQHQPMQNITNFVIKPLETPMLQFHKGPRRSTKKQINSVRCVIQQARQAKEYPNIPLSTPQVQIKKNMPLQLQPLSKPELQGKLDRIVVEEKEAKEGKAMERFRKLQKINTCSGGAKHE